MSHPALGLPPLDETAGYPEAAARLRASKVEVGRRALDAAMRADPTPMRTWAEQLAPVYRRRRVSMDDLSRLAEGFRSAVRFALTPVEQPAADAAIDAAIEVFRWHRRLAGDARKRNKLLQLLYKGA